MVRNNRKTLNTPSKPFLHESMKSYHIRWSYLWKASQCTKCPFEATSNSGHVNNSSKMIWMKDQWQESVFVQISKWNWDREANSLYTWFFENLTGNLQDQEHNICTRMAWYHDPSSNIHLQSVSKKTEFCRIEHLQILLAVGEKYLWF